MNENNESNGFESNDSTGTFEQELEAHAEDTNSTEELLAGEGEEMRGEHYKGEHEHEGFQFSDDPSPQEAEALMGASGEGAAQTEGKADVVTDAGGDKPKAAAYESFIAAIKAHGEALGLTVRDQKGFVKFLAPTTDQRLYVAKQPRGVTRIDTTLPRTALIVNGRDISLPLSKENGKIECHIDPTIESVNAALTVLASFQAKVRAAKAPTKAA